jgi:hypothetical protein
MIASHTKNIEVAMVRDIYFLGGSVLSLCTQIAINIILIAWKIKLNEVLSQKALVYFGSSTYL